LRNKVVSAARKSIQKNMNLNQLYQSMQEAYDQMQTPLAHQIPPPSVYIILSFPNDFKFVIFLTFIQYSVIQAGAKGDEGIHHPTGSKSWIH